MPANRFNAFTDYGIGIGLRIPHYQHIFEKKPIVDWFEIISENYTVDVGRPLRILDQYRVVQHGVSMYFGSAQPLKLNVEQQAAVLRESFAHASELGWFCLPEVEEDSRLLVM